MGFNKKKRDVVWEKSNGKCWYCGCVLLEKWHIDHIVPKRKNGSNDIDNLVPSCPTCNLFKKTFDLNEFRYELSTQINRARKYSINFRLAEKYNQLIVEEKPIVFWFEKKGY